MCIRYTFSSYSRIYTRAQNFKTFVQSTSTQRALMRDVYTLLYNLCVHSLLVFRFEWTRNSSYSCERASLKTLLAVWNFNLLAAFAFFIQQKAVSLVVCILFHVVFKCNRRKSCIQRVKKFANCVRTFRTDEQKLLWYISVKIEEKKKVERE